MYRDVLGNMGIGLEQPPFPNLGTPYLGMIQFLGCGFPSQTAGFLVMVPGWGGWELISYADAAPSRAQ